MLDGSVRIAFGDRSVWGFLMREKERLTKVGSRAAVEARLRSALQKQRYRENVKARDAEMAELTRVLGEDEVKARLGLTQADVDKLRDIVQNPGRNAMAQLGAIRTMLQYTVAQPKQEFSGDIGIQVVVNTLRKLPPVVDVTPDGSETP
jgi:hypothetical protein